jgi:hypothetical protein
MAPRGKRVNAAPLTELYARPGFLQWIVQPGTHDSVNMAEVRKTNLMLKYGLLKKPVDLSGRLLSLP